MPRVFISYRRADTLAVAGRVDDRLCGLFGRANVFRDVDTVPPGVDFRQHVNDAINRCDAVVVLIGKAWLETNADGTRRINNPSDLVRLEIEAALSNATPILPVSRRRCDNTARTGHAAFAGFACL